MLGPIILSAAIGAASLSTPTDLRPIFDRPAGALVERADSDARIVGSAQRTANGLVYLAATRDSERSDRARLHAQDDATEVIYVEVDGNIFAIDPFVPIERRPTEADVRFVFGQRGLTDDLGRSTNRTRFSGRYRAVETLFRRLETARNQWLRDRGLVQSVRTWGGSPRGEGLSTSESTMPRPSGVIELPADFPRTKALESVDAGSVPTRISVPPTVPQRIADSLKSRVEPTRIVRSEEESASGDEG